MHKVRLGGPLMTMAGGRSEFEIEAANIREMLEKLAEAYPVLRPMLLKGVTVAVNGEVFQGAFLTPIPEGSEVFLLPAMQGG
jgi:molybdopterin converting factor small subunit